MNKIINKILDNYYKDKLVDEIIYYMRAFSLSSILEEHKNYIELKIKSVSDIKDMYVSIIKIRKKDSLYCLMHFEELKTGIYKGIKWYEEGWIISEKDN